MSATSPPAEAREHRMARHLIEKLGKFTRLSGDDQHILQCLAQRRVKDTAAREDLIREGDKPTSIWIIQQGWTCRYKMLEDGRRQIISFGLPGDICDLNSFLMREMDHSIASITPVTVSEISAQDIEAMTAKSSRLLQALWWSALVDAAIQREMAVSLGIRTAFERLSHIFCEVFLRLQAVGLTDGKSCEMPLTQIELGEAMGLSTVHVNRTLQDLRAANLIVLRQRILTIPDLGALQDAGAFDGGYLHLAHEGRHLDSNE